MLFLFASFCFCKAPHQSKHSLNINFRRDIETASLSGSSEIVCLINHFLETPGFSRVLILPEFWKEHPARFCVFHFTLEVFMHNLSVSQNGPNSLFMRYFPQYSCFGSMTEKLSVQLCFPHVANVLSQYGASNRRIPFVLPESVSCA